MKTKNDLRYLRIANTLEAAIRSGNLKPGDRLPSVRRLAEERGVSPGTATLVYLELESRSLVTARPRSGFFVSQAPQSIKALPTPTRPPATHRESDTRKVIDTVLANAPRAKIFLSSGVPSTGLLPVARLNKAMVQALRDLPDGGTGYDRQGNSRLRQQVALRSAHWGGGLQPSDIITTAGCMDALSFCMQSLLKKGDSIGIESPLYFGILQMARNMGLNVVELPMHPLTGVEPDALAKAMRTRKIKACLLVSNFSNPLGSCMPDEHKQAVALMAEQYGVPVIEDDLYGDLYHGTRRPLTCKSFDEAGRVLYCNSFSKTLAAGYRVGWVAPGRYYEQVARTKNYHSISCNTVAHEAVGNFLESGRYEQHLRNLRRSLYHATAALQNAIAQHFPGQVKVSRPEGGFHLWVELGKRVNTLALYDKAIAQGISFAPGRLYTLRNQYNNCLRLSSGVIWNEKQAGALLTLGRLIHQL